MVNLSRIYTRTGDAGKTRLGGGEEVAKTHSRVQAYGDVDELNSVLGLASTAESMSRRHLEILRWVQNDLFDLGADLCRPRERGETPSSALRIQASQVRRVEEAIDEINAPLPPLTSFVLPGGTAPSAWLHLARTVCRRAERHAWQLAEVAAVNEHSLIYLNRLSDLLFVMARGENLGSDAENPDSGAENPDSGAENPDSKIGGEVLWEPGLTREPENI